MTALIWLALVAALTVGYLLGRARLWLRLGSWADWQVGVDGRWWLATRPRQAAVAAVFAATSPRAAWNAWRHRNDPPPTHTTPVFNPQWAADRVQPPS